MKILAFDSTAKAASIAVLDDEVPLAVYTIDNGLTQSELLLPMAEDALRELKLDISDIELFACSVGPGSFTGVRIGAALVKGLAFGRSIPCASVSTLEALAENLSGIDGIIVPVMDARRGQVYTATFTSATDSPFPVRLCADRAISIAELAEELRGFDGKKIYLVGDGYEICRAEMLSMGIKPECTPPLLLSENAYSVGRVAKRKFDAGEGCDDLALNPTYLRVPQAERERLLRENANKQN